MSDKVPMEFSSYMGPDALRKTTQLLKNLYDVHTKRYCGYEDINGSQYVGTVENFGSEMLLESRKLLLDKPSLKNIFIENTFDFYFDIQYSELIDTYDQQNMLCAVLRKDVFLQGYQYRIQFNDFEFVNIPRAHSWSDPDVFKDPYIRTKTPPTLLITNPGGAINRINLVLSDDTDVDTVYYFRLYNDMKKFYNISYADIMEGESFTTEILDDSMNGLPFIWMCVNKFNLLPDVGFTNNIIDEKTFLTIGTDGHDFSLVYPGLNLINSNLYMAIKIIPDETIGFMEDNTSVNYNVNIKEIHLLRYDNESFDIRTTPISDIVITYNDSYTRMTLSDNIEWSFNKPRVGDYDYDGRTYINPCYAWTPITSFSDNFNDSDIVSSSVLIPGFKISFNEEYRHNFEALNGDGMSGIHIDVTSDYSNNGVSKKNGVIYDLGDFDGLPPYFGYMIDDTIHRAHVEAYSIRNALDDRNRFANDKQTAAIIIDSGIPQNEVQKITSDMPIVIQFDWNDAINRKYITVGEPISKKDFVSEITFVDNNTFGNSKSAKYQFTDKFVYHGNRLFSLGISGFDPEMETGRVYLITNDSAIYENNETTRNKKAPVTFARICDIPTDFSQLVNIKNIAPTLIIDPEYVRTENSYDTDDKNVLYNLTTIDHVLTPIDSIVFPSSYVMDLPSIEDVEKSFPKYIRLNEQINLNDTENIIFNIGSRGTGYTVNDEFLFYIGGLCINGIVKAVDNGGVTEVAYIMNDSNGKHETESPTLPNPYIARSNFKDRYNVFETKKVISNGSGLTIIMSISNEIWDNSNMMTNGLLSDIYSFKFDDLDNIWVWEFNGVTWNQDIQLTGIKIYHNIYEEIDHGRTNSLRDVLIHNMIRPVSNDIVSSEVQSSNIFIQTVPREEDIFSTDDRSVAIEKARRNRQNGFIFLDTGNETSKFHDVTIYEKDKVNTTQYDLEFPVHNDLNLSDYTNKSNKLRFCCDQQQPSIRVYNPTITTHDDYEIISSDIVSMKGSRPILLSDVFDNSIYTPENLINQNGVLSRNIYSFDEYTTSEHDILRMKLSSYTREDLIEYIKDRYSDAYPLKFERTEYHYSKEMLINYIMTNTVLWNRPTYVYDEDTAPESIYRRPTLKLYKPIGEQVELYGKPIGEQPTGAFQSVSTDIFDPVVKVDNTNKKASPTFIFRLDNPEITSLKGFRMRDDDNNDISEMTLLILNGEIYTAINTSNDIDWIKIERSED